VTYPKRSAIDFDVNLWFWVAPLIRDRNVKRVVVY
jgi:hypothetical protein